VTTLRKVVSILLSYVIFTKPLLGEHELGLILIGFGVLVKTLPQEITLTRFRKGRPTIFRPVASRRSQERLSKEETEKMLEEPRFHRVNRTVPTADFSFKPAGVDESEENSKAELHEI
jgi:hypothetical protein